MRYPIFVCLLVLSLGFSQQSPQQGPFLRITPREAGPPAEPKEGVVDQSFQEPQSLGANINSAHPLTAQTYTAGLTGRLTGINIDVSSKRGVNPENNFAKVPLRVALCEVERVENRYPGQVVAEVTLADDEAPLSTLITFPKVVRQVKGTHYAIVVNYPNAPAKAGWLGNWAGGRGNIGGEMFFGDDGRYWNTRRTNDYTLRFRSYVVPD